MKIELQTRKQAMEIIKMAMAGKGLYQYWQNQASDLSQLDRRYIRQLVNSVIRFHTTLEQTAKKLTKPPSNQEAWIYLLIGLAQIYLLNSKDHGVVHPLVEITKKDKSLRHFSGWLNGCLRSAIRKKEILSKELDWEAASIPTTLLNRWKKHYDEATIYNLRLEAGKAPKLHLQCKSNAKELATKLNGSLGPDGRTIILEYRGEVSSLSDWQTGDYWVQDAAAALAVQLLACDENKYIVDLCAAPGGKTMQLASTGAKVDAIEVQEKRIGRLQENLERTGFLASNRINIIKADARSWKPKTKPDAVLLDAPCMATGTVRRRPDVWLRAAKTNVNELAELQQAILENAISMLGSGGILIYVVCSLEPEEGEKSIQSFLNRHKDVQCLPPTKSEIKGFEASLQKDGSMRILPQHWSDYGGCDGFYMVRLRKK